MFVVYIIHVGGYVLAPSQAQLLSCVCAGSGLCYPPAVLTSSHGCRMFYTLGRSPFAFMKFGLCTDALGQSALPSFPSVKYQQSAIPYVAVVVFSCERDCISL